jgi:threonine aldolase
VGTSAADARQWEARLARAGVLVRTGGAGLLRLVTHRHIDDAAVDRTLQVFAGLQAGATDAGA